MLVAITIQLIAEAQAKSTGFTLDDAADIIIGRAELTKSLGAPVDVFDLAAAVAVKLGVGARQEIGIVQAVLRKTEAAAA